jgi:hypothetical protein
MRREKAQREDTGSTKADEMLLNYPKIPFVSFCASLWQESILVPFCG